MTLMEVFRAEERGEQLKPKEPKGRNPLAGLYTVPEAARQKDVAISAVARALKEGRLCAWTKGGIHLIPWAELAKWEPVRGRGKKKEPANG